LRVKSLVEIAAQQGFFFPGQDLSALVQIQAREPLTFVNFLSKFQTLRQFYRSQEIIERLTREVIEDAARDGILHLELRFTPSALATVQGFTIVQVMDWVSCSAVDAAQKAGISVKLIASVNRNEPVALAEDVARLAAERLDQGIVGLDLAGNEAQFPALPFAGLFREAEQSGLHVTIHAGEWGGAENVREAIEELHAERVGHGVRVMESPSMVRAASERNIAFEVCLTSNIQSGVFPSLESHPLPRMLESGLCVTLATDDPSISGITLSEEYILAQEKLGIDRLLLERCILDGARAAFLPINEKELLQNQLQAELNRILI